MDTGNFTNSECSCFCLKRRTSLHKVIGSLAFRLGGDMLYIGTNTEKKSFFVNRFTNSDTYNGLILHVYGF